MIIKKYQAKTEAEAVEQAKKELGQSVVIMNVRNVKRKGIFSIFKSKMIEITVALEEEEKTALKKESQPMQTLEKQENTMKKTPLIPEELVQSTLEKSETSANGRTIEEKLNSLQNLLEKQLKPAEEEKPEAEEPEKKSEIAAFIQLLYNTMIENEVHERYANMIIDDLEKSRRNDAPIDHLLANVYQKMVLKFGKPSGITPGQNMAKTVFFIGPTGVGKTTTIAKIASKFCLEEKKKIVLLTTDTYRIAAAEQLRTYANILDVPFRVIYSVEEMMTAWNAYKDYDYILVDTAGHSHQNDEQKQNMQEYLDAIDADKEKEAYLVLSATTKYRDLISIADTYTGMVDYKLIFTKLDETSTYGNLFNLKMHTGAEMSYVTCGQNVPNDIDEFNPQATVRKLLGG